MIETFTLGQLALLITPIALTCLFIWADGIGKRKKRKEKHSPVKQTKKGKKKLK